MKSRFLTLTLTLALTLTALAAAGIASAQMPHIQPELFLSWHAPYGMEGATDTLNAVCTDTSRTDTLYLSFRPGGFPMRMLSMSGVLYFHPQRGDSLGPFWWFKRGWPNETNLRVDFDRIANFPIPVPWEAIGYGKVEYDHRSGRGRLDLDFYIPDKSHTVPAVPEEHYAYARVMIRHKRTDLAGCSQPVCVEFASATLHYANGRSAEFHGGQRALVRYNPIPGRECDLPPATSLAKPWTPKTTVPGNPSTR